MDSELESGQSSNRVGDGLISRKRKKYGHVKDVMKKIRLNSYTTCEDC